MRFLHLTLFITRFLRVSTPFDPLNCASHSPALVHPEALHFSETLSLGNQILRVPTPFDPLNRASHSPAVVHPEALHFSETFSLGMQIKQLI